MEISSETIKYYQTFPRSMGNIVIKPGNKIDYHV